MGILHSPAFFNVLFVSPAYIYDVYFLDDIATGRHMFIIPSLDAILPRNP